MPTTIFEWIARTAMLAMAGLVTLSILGAIAAIGENPRTGFAGPADRPAVQGDRPREGEAAEPPTAVAEEGNAAVSAMRVEEERGRIVAARPAPDDKVARWLEAIAYGLLALAGIGALGVLMLWSILLELRRTRSA